MTANFSPPLDATADIINYGSTYPSASGTGTFNVTGTATVTGDFLNFGNVKTTGADVTWNGNFMNNNVYTSDPSKQTFNGNLVVNTGAVLKATSPLGPGGNTKDKFIFKEDFIATSDGVGSPQETAWSTYNAGMVFNKGTDKDHILTVMGDKQGKPGRDMNNVVNVVTGDYAWGSLDITNQTIHLVDGRTAPNKEGALYVNFAMVGVGLDTVNHIATNIFGPTGAGNYALNIYYNPDVNTQFGDVNWTYASGKGQLIAYAPLPPSMLLLGSGLLGMGLLGYRRKRLMG